MEAGVKMIGSNTELWELIKARKQALCPLGKLFNIPQTARPPVLLEKQ